LSAEERARAATYSSQEARGQYVSRRAWLREMLALYLGCRADVVPLVDALHGRPTLAASSRLVWNLARSRWHCVLAVARTHATRGLHGGRAPLRLGVDLEPAGRLAAWADEIVTHWFTTRERAVWAETMRSAPLQSGELFAAWWTAKEAWLKAVGIGLL